MARYRIGNDMTVVWSIYDHTGAAYNLKGKEVRLYYTCERGRFEVDFELQGTNIVVWRFFGREQKVIGDYTLSLEIIESADKRRILKDYCNAFTLVGKSCEEAALGNPNISEDGNIVLSSKLDVYRIQPIIPTVGSNSNWFVNGTDTGKPSTGKSAYEYAKEKGYEGTESEYAECLKLAPENSEKLAELSAEVSGLSEDAVKINDITSAIKSNNINSAKIESGGYSPNYEKDTIDPFASATLTRGDRPIYFEQGKSIYMILENAPSGMKFINIIPIDVDGKPVGTANVHLFAKNISSANLVFTPPQGAVGMLFYASSNGQTDYKVGLYYTDYQTSVVEDYVPDEVVVNADKLAKNGKRVVYEEKKDADLFKERLGYDKEISEELPAIDNPDAEYAKHLISAVRQEISEIWRWMARKEEVTILDSGVCGENLNWALYSDGLLRISGEGRAYDYCKGLLMDELVGPEYDSLPTMRAKIEQYQSHYIGLTDENSVAKYERGFQEGKIYDDEHEQYFAPWYIYRPEQDFTEYGGGYSSKANYDMHNPNGWQYNRIIIDEGVTYLGNWMLYRLCGVSELVLPSSVKGIGQWCIRYSPSLKCVYLNDGIETIEKQGCSRLETCEAIRMGDGYTRVEDSAFAQNSKVKSMYLSGNIDYVGVRPFAYNYEMTDITIKGVTSIGVWFTGCDALQRVQLSEGLVTIEPSAFVSRKALRTINIPSSVTTIGKSAFYNCPNLKIVYIDSPTIAANVINEAGTSSADFLVKNVEYLYINSNIETIGAWILENFTKVNDADGYALYVRNS